MNLNKNTIIAELWTNPKLDAMLAKFNAGGGQEDLKSELFAVICEKPEDKLIEMYSNGQLMYFATGVVQRMIFQKGNKFNRMYRNCVYELTDARLSMPDESDAVEREQRMDKLTTGIDKLHWVEQSMLEIWQREGDVVSIKRKTNIPYRQILKIMSNAKAKLKEEISGKMFGNYIVATMGIVLDCDESVTPENVIDILEDTLDYLKKQTEGRQVPSKSCNKIFIKELKPIKISKVI